MKITAMKVTPSHKLTQQVKHPATTRPDLILPFSPRGQRIWSTSVFFKCVSSPSHATSRDKEKRMKSQNCWTNGPRPNLLFFFCFSFSPHATWWHKANSPDTAPYLSSNDFSVFPLRRLVAQSRSPRHTAQSVSDGFFFLTPPRGTVCFSFLFFFSTPPRGTEQKSPTHCSKRSSTDHCFLFLSFPYTTSWHIFLFFTPPRSTEQTFSTHC